MLQRELTGLAVFLEEAPQIGTSPQQTRNIKKYAERFEE